MMVAGICTDLDHATFDSPVGQALRSKQDEIAGLRRRLAAVERERDESRASSEKLSAKADAALSEGETLRRERDDARQRVEDLERESNSWLQRKLSLKSSPTMK